MSSRSSVRRRLRGRTVALVPFVALLAAIPTAGTARAEDPPPEPITTGSVDWGVKQSFRAYIGGSIARGTTTVADGATVNGDGTFRFPITGGAFDPVTGATSVASAGGVRFSGHAGELDLRIDDVRVELTEEGALLRADVTSRPLGSTEPTVFGDVALAQLDLAGVNPASAAGVTTWTDVPATLTAAGAPAFSGFYSAGTPLDAVTFSYVGNGGKPAIERFTAPRSPFYARRQVLSPGRSDLHLDAGRDLLFKLDNQAISAVDAETLEPVGSPLEIPQGSQLNRIGSAYDADAARLYVAWLGGEISAFDWTGSGFTRDELPGTHGTGKLAVANGRLYVASEGSFTTSDDPTVTVISGGPGAWSVDAGRPAIDTGGTAISQLVGLPDGRLVAALTGKLVFSPSLAGQPREAIVISDSGSAFTTAAIAGTTPPPLPTAGRVSTGYTTIERGPEGSLLLGEFTNDATLTRLQWLRYDAGGVTVDGGPIDVGNRNSFAVAPDDGRIYLSFPSNSEDLSQSRVEVLERDGSAFATIPGLKTNRLAAAAGGVLYGLLNQSPVPTVRMQLAGSSPAVTADPQDQAVELPAAGAAATATFTAAAEADPAPAVRWQRRALGATRWSDVEGATTATLAVPVTAATDGTRFRALFENGGGRIATRAATVTVTVAPPAVDPGGPPRVDPGPPSTPLPPTTPVAPPATPAPSTPSAPVARRLSARSDIAAVRAAQRPGRDGVARVATLRCPAGTRGGCRIVAPARVKVRIGGRVFRARILAPGRVRAGRSAALRVRLPEAARSRLAGRRATVTVRVALSGGGQRVSRQVSVGLRGR
jgi:hypothetical protein